MTREQKVEWLENATGEQLLKQYQRTLGRLNRVEVFSNEWAQLLEDQELVEKEMLRRMGN